MLENDRIFTHFLAMSGLEEQDAQALRPLCDAAGIQIVSRLRESISPGRHMDRLCLAAAAIALSDWLELGGGAMRAQEVRVGEITLREGGAGALSRSSDLRERFLAGVADLLVPSVVLSCTGGQPEEEK